MRGAQILYKTLRFTRFDQKNRQNEHLCKQFKIFNMRVFEPKSITVWRRWQRQRQHDSGCIFATLIVYLITFLSKVFSFNDFFGGQGRDGQTDGRTKGQTDGHMDRQTFLGKYYFR